MSYEEFKNEVRRLVAARCEEGDEVDLITVTKNNATRKDALIIRRKGQNIAPNLYLESFYREFQDGMTIEDIVDQVMTIEKNCKRPDFFSLDDFSDYEKVKNKIYARLVRRDLNVELLHKAPHRDVMDLAVVYYVLHSSEQYGMATTVVLSDFLSHWRVTEEELHENAMNNTFSNLGVVVSSITDMLEDMLREKGAYEAIGQLEEIRRQETDRMFVVSNTVKNYGAVNLLYSDFLKTFATKYGSFYVIPSSIHELIFVPSAEQSEEESRELQQMVSEVNRSELLPEEILSDHVYFYNSKTDELKMAC